MLEWPGRCASCKKDIDDWSAAGLFEGRWIHKQCWTQNYASTVQSGLTPEPLQSPVDRSRQLEWPMLLFALLFHFGLGFAVIGWIILDQDRGHTSAGYISLAVGFIAPLIGVAGVAINVISRRRIEQIRELLDLRGGWKPGL